MKQENEPRPRIDTANFTPEQQKLLAFAEQLANEGDFVLDLAAGNFGPLIETANHLGIPSSAQSIQKTLVEAVALYHQVYPAEAE